MRRWRCVVALALLPWSATVIAQDAYDTVSAAACERMKSCALRNMQDVPPEYRDMLTQGLESMCAYLPSSDTIPGFNAMHPSYRASLACLKSIAETSCEVLEAQENSTPQCDELNRLNEASTAYPQASGFQP